MITLAFGQMFFFFAISLERLWWRRRSVDLCAQRLSRPEHAGAAEFYGLCLVILLAVLWFALAGALVLRPGLECAPARCRCVVETVGLNPLSPAARVAFVISGAITGLAGSHVRGPEPLRQSDHVQLADFRRNHDLHHPRRVSAGCSVRWLAHCVYCSRLSNTCSAVLSDYWHIYLGPLLLLIVLFGRGGLIGIGLGTEGGS